MLLGCKITITSFAIQWWLLLIFSVVSVPSSAEDGVMNRLINVDFQLNKKEEGVIIVELASAASAVDLRTENTQLMIELHDTQVSDDKLIILDVEDFATSVSHIETFREPNSTLLVVDIKGGYQYDYVLKDNSLQVVISKQLKQANKIQIGRASCRERVFRAV